LLKQLHTIIFRLTSSLIRIL